MHVVSRKPLPNCYFRVASIYLISFLWKIKYMFLYNRCHSCFFLCGGTKQSSQDTSFKDKFMMRNQKCRKSLNIAFLFYSGMCQGFVWNEIYLSYKIIWLINRRKSRSIKKLSHTWKRSCSSFLVSRIEVRQVLMLVT